MEKKSQPLSRSTKVDPVKEKAASQLIYDYELKDVASTHEPFPAASNCDCCETEPDILERVLCRSTFDLKQEFFVCRPCLSAMKRYFR